MTVRQLAEATWPDLASRPTVVVPVGSTEQHGPHLPVATDTIIASAVANALADELDGYVAPAVSITASGEHQGFPGVASIGSEALRLTAIELVRSLSLWAGRVLLVNAHGGNTTVLTAATRQLAMEGHRVTLIPCQAAGDAHAGYTETSIMLHLAPHLVRQDRLEPGNTTPLPEMLSALRSLGVRALAANGVLGDPRGANAQEGALLFDRMVRNAHDAIG